MMKKIVMTVKYTLCVNEGEEEKNIHFLSRIKTHSGRYLDYQLSQDSFFRRKSKRERERERGKRKRGERKECRFNEITFSPLDRDDDDGRLIILFDHVGRERSENESISFFEKKEREIRKQIGLEKN